MVEVSTVGTVARPPQGASGDARWAYRISQGRFPASLEYRVVNDGQVVATTDRNAGEIQVRGNMVTKEYYDAPSGHEDGAAAEFRGKPTDTAADKFTADGWLRTGDVGYVNEDGFLSVSDRARDVIRSGGEWIYSVQLENLIMNDGDVVEAAVIGYPDKNGLSAHSPSRSCAQALPQPSKQQSACVKVCARSYQSGCCRSIGPCKGPRQNFRRQIR